MLRIVIASGLLSLLAGCATLATPPGSIDPRAVDDGIAISTPSAVGLDPDAVADLYRRAAADPAFRHLRSLLILRDGQLVAEGYFNNTDPDAPQNLKSVTKSVVSLLAGVAIADGRVRLDSTVGELLAASIGARDPDAETKRSITLAQLLTMESGLEWHENIGWLWNISWDPNRMFLSGDTVRYVLSRPMEDRPGGHAHYSTGTLQLVAAMLQRATAEPVAGFAQARLFAPLGISEPRWDTGRDGLHYGGVGLWLTPREAAKIGLLCLDDGRWRGQPILPAGWMEASTRAHTQFGNDRPYGYAWWLRPHGYAAEGYGGQFIYVMPRHRMVVVTTANHLTPDPIEIGMLEKLLQPVLPAAAATGATAASR